MPEVRLRGEVVGNPEKQTGRDREEVAEAEGEGRFTASQNQNKMQWGNTGRPTPGRQEGGVHPSASTTDGGGKRRFTEGEGRPWSWTLEASYSIKRGTISREGARSGPAEEKGGAEENGEASSR